MTETLHRARTLVVHKRKKRGLMPGAAMTGCPICKEVFTVEHGTDARPGHDANQKVRKAVQRHVEEDHGQKMPW